MSVMRRVARLSGAVLPVLCVLVPSACEAPPRSDSEPVDFTASALRAAKVRSALAGPVDASARTDADQASLAIVSNLGGFASSRGLQATPEPDAGFTEFTELTLGTVSEPVAFCPDLSVALCQVGPPLAPSCSEGVCTKDPYCCNTYWDALCVTEASERVADCPCTHAFDTPGLRLVRGCDDPDDLEQDCPSVVCDSTIGDAFCCNTEWDWICVGHAAGLQECDG